MNSLIRFYLKNLLIAVLLFTSYAVDADDNSQANASGPAVLVEHNKEYYGFMTLPRLSEVLAPAMAAPALYWPASRLYHTDVAEVTELEQTRQKILQQLHILQQYYVEKKQSELADSVSQLQQQVGGWVLARQQLMPLDPDLVRIKAELNPILLPGQYLLQVTERPASLVVNGLAENQQIPYRNVTDAADYIEELTLIAGASRSFLYFLPAGKPAMLAKTGLWNRQRQEIPPGAIIFVPFEQRLLPGDFAGLNQQIVALLQHRVIL